MCMIVEGHNWACSGSPAVPGHGPRGAVVWWHLSVLAVDEDQMKSGGVRVVVMMKRVEVSKTASGFDQAMGIRSRRGLQRHKMSRK